jgi:putative FmdB family regulatory protein
VPTYQYACTECGHELEAVQSFTDDALTVCPQCGGRLRKVFSAVGVVFKGSGFYRTDSRTGKGSAKESGKESTKESGTGSSKESGASGTGAASSSSKEPKAAPSSSSSSSGSSGTSGGSSAA